MPPIINGDHTKITLDTTDVFIDMTATDETKLYICMNIIVTMFSEYCKDPFVCVVFLLSIKSYPANPNFFFWPGRVEPVKVIYPDGRTVITPDLKPIPMTAETSYINSFLGLSLSTEEICKLIARMGSEAVPSPTNDGTFTVQLPPTRPDVLHPVDLVEEAAIAYGFNKLVKTFPSTNTVAQPLPINKLSDIMRRECAMAGWVEALPLILVRIYNSARDCCFEKKSNPLWQCSKEENFKFLNRVDDGETAVELENPKTIEYQIVRTSLLPGLLKTVRENRKHTLPLSIFETSDIAVKDASMERRSRNERRVAAVFCGRKAGFEVVHGLLDRLMLALGVKLLDSKEAKKSEPGYFIEAADGACESKAIGCAVVLIFLSIRPDVLPRPGCKDLLPATEILRKNGTSGRRSVCEQGRRVGSSARNPARAVLG
jgi:phenylalanyl-tRNA synthetase beta chain